MKSETDFFHLLEKHPTKDIHDSHYNSTKKLLFLDNVFK